MGGGEGGRFLHPKLIFMSEEQSGRDVAIAAAPFGPILIPKFK